MNILEILNLNKSFTTFQLKDISFNLEQGYIMGLIGANGAGKTTTIKSMLNIITPDSGSVKILGKDFTINENELKQNIGFVVGESSFYSKRKIRTITNIVKNFYINWDDEVYFENLKRFNLDENKKICELSSGMQIKYSISIALSYGAKLFILDEPTSGLDPVARDNLLELFQELVEGGDRSIIFSTHITSDLEKCADYITYIDNGELIGSASKDNFIDEYRLINGTKDELEKIKDKVISFKTNSFGFTALIHNKSGEFHEFNKTIPNLDDIMIYYAKRRY